MVNNNIDRLVDEWKSSILELPGALNLTSSETLDKISKIILPQKKGNN